MRKTFAVVMMIVCLSISPVSTCIIQAADKNAASGYETTISAARETIWKAITSGKGSGATIAVMDQNRIIYSEGIGVADRSRNRLVDKGTRFNIGSTSKMFAAVAILLLADEGKVVLDERVTKYVPGFKMKDERYKKITVRMLFNHSSGLPGSSFYFGYKPDTRMHEMMLDTLKDEYLKHDPGAMSMYCNDGFTLAEIIVEKVSGRKYLNFLKERIFIPLGMKNTSASIGETDEANVAEFYDPKTGKRYPREAVSVYATGGLSSTAEDLCRFGDSFSKKGKRILSDASIREILKTQPTLFSDKLKDRQIMSEFGWEYTGLPGYREKGIQVLGKGGNTIFYSANLQIVPEEGIAIGFAISGNASGEALTRPVLDALMKDRKVMAEKVRTVKIPVEPQPFPADMIKYAGYYVNEGSLAKASFDRLKQTLILLPVTAKKAGNPNLMTPLSFIYNNGFFHNSDKDIKCYFTTVDGTVFIVSHGAPPYGGDTLMFQKLEANKKVRLLKENMQGKNWLMRNASPYIQIQPATPSLTAPSSVYRDLPGYVEFQGVKRIERADYAGIAATAFRDQSDLSVFSKNGRTWAKTGYFLWSRADDAAAVKDGTTNIKIGNDGYNEWVKLGKGAVLSFEKPENGRIIVSTPDAVLFDSVVDSGETYAPAGSYVFCAGSAGDIFKIKAAGV